jgi:oligopeptide transport system substrate-binding protein
LAVPGGFRTTPQFLQASWRQHLGIEVEIIENMATDQMLESLSQGTIQLALIGWDVEYPDPDSALRVLFHSASPINYFGWGNPVFDQLVEQAASSSQQSQRLELYHQADQILVAEDTAVVPLYYYQAYGLMRPHFSIQGSGKIIRGGTFKFKNIVFN